MIPTGGIAGNATFAPATGGDNGLFNGDMEGFPIVVELEVRYRDLDPLGHVNNAVYLSYIELARVRYFEAFGADVVRGDAAPVVARAEVDYERPIFLGARLRVGARVSRLGRSSFDMLYQIEADGALAAKAKTVHVWLGKDGRPTPLPQAVRDRVRALETLPVDGLS